MANPTFVAAGTKTGSTGNATPPLPTGHAADDLLLLLCETRDTDSVTAPAGWNEITTVDSGSALPLVDSTDATRLSVFWKIDGGSETDPTITDPGNHIICAILAFRGTDLTDPFNLIVTSVETTSNTTVTITGGTTTVDDCLVVAITSNTTDSASAQLSNWANGSLTSPGFFEIVDDFGNSNLGGGFAAASGGIDTAGTVASSTATLTTAARDQNVMIALQPPQGGSTHYDQTIGHVPTDKAVYGLGTPGALGQTLGHIAGGHREVYGLGLPVAANYGIGHVGPHKAVYGLGLPMAGAQAVGHVGPHAAVRGLDLPLSASYPIGHVPSHAAVYGLGLSLGSAAYTLSIGHLKSAGRPGAYCKLGVSNQVLGGQDLHAVEAEIGRPFVGLRQNQGYATHGWTGADGFYDDYGYRLTYRDIQLDDAGSWANVPLGTYDTDLDAIFSGLMADGRWGPLNPAYICFTHETSIAGDGGAGTPQEYIDAWRYVRLFADAMGASMWSVTGEWIGGPIIWCFVGWDRMFVDIDGNVPPDIDQAMDTYDPDLGTDPAPAGTSYYELIGSDVYNDITAGSLKYGTDAATLLDPIYQAALARGKDWMLGEWACADGATTTDHENKAAWIDSFRTFISGIGAGPSRCVFACSTVKISASGYQPESSAESLAAWITLANDPYFCDGLGPAVRGLDFGALSGSQDIGHLGGGTLRGLDLPLAATYPIGHVGPHAAVRGLDLPLAASQAIGHVPTHEAVRGLGLLVAATQTLGHIAGGHREVYGLGLRLAVALGIGHVPSTKQIYGLGLPVDVLWPLHIVPVYDNTETVPVFVNASGVPCYNINVSLPVYGGSPLVPIFVSNFTVPVQ